MCVCKKIAQTVNNFEVEFSNYSVVCVFSPALNSNLFLGAPTDDCQYEPWKRFTTPHNKDLFVPHFLQPFFTDHLHFQFLLQFNLNGHLAIAKSTDLLLCVTFHYFPFILSRNYWRYKKWLSEIKMKIKDKEGVRLKRRIIFNFNYHTKSSVNTEKEIQTDKKMML